MHKDKRIILSMIAYIILFTCCISAKNLPIVLVHGILSDKYAMIPTQEFIKKYLQNTYVKRVNLGEGTLTSICNMHDQVAWLKQEMESDIHLRNGCIIIGHSQGGPVARYFIEKYNNPRVYVYISWGSPEAGVFGAPGDFDQRFGWLKKIETYAHHFLYSYPMQRWVSFAGYWKDPIYHEQYLAKSNFLPYLNNECDHADSALFKNNISNLLNMVLVQSTIDDVIDPIESCHFGFYTAGSLHTIEPLYNSAWYHNDKLGIKTLAESGRLHLRFAHCVHTDFQIDEQNFVENTLPFLSVEMP